MQVNLEYKQEKKIIFKLHLHPIWSFRHHAKPLFMGFSAIFSSYSNSHDLVWFWLFQYGYLYCFILIFRIFSTRHFSFHIFLVPIQYHCIFSLLCVVPMACRLVYYSENNHLIVCKSTYGNYNLRTMFLQLEILRY